MRPMNERVLIKRLSGETKRGELFIPDLAQKKSMFAKVLAVGRGRMLECGARMPLTVQVGDTVIVGEYSGADLVVDGEECIMVRESEILAIC